jgi:putative salt-induced outer membrane protein YdiY
MKRLVPWVQLWLKVSAILCLLVFVVNSASGKRKDDVVVMKNGDTFTGEIKDLEYGELIFKSSYMKDSVHLDWKRVQSLRSKDTFIIVLSDGRRLTGTIQKRTSGEKEKDEFRIVVAEGAIEIPPAEVIRIEQREVSFWNQLAGSVNYGFSFAGGNRNTVNSSLAADVAFNTEKNSTRLATSSQFDSQTNAQNTNRFTFDTLYGRALTTKWIATALFSLLKSDQQDLNLRSSYGGGLGRRLIQNDRTSLLAMGGLAYNHESYLPQPGIEPNRNNAEGLLGITFNTFRFKTLNLNSQAFLFPSLNDPGRFRLSSQSNLRIELVRNFTWNFQVYENYDTRPPVNAPKNDLGLTTSLGWTF